MGAAKIGGGGNEKEKVNIAQAHTSNRHQRDEAGGVELKVKPSKKGMQEKASTTRYPDLCTICTMILSKGSQVGSVTTGQQSEWACPRKLKLEQSGGRAGDRQEMKRKKREWP